MCLLEIRVLLCDSRSALWMIRLLGPCSYCGGVWPPNSGAENHVVGSGGGGGLMRRAWCWATPAKRWLHIVWAMGVLGSHAASECLCFVWSSGSRVALLAMQVAGRNLHMICAMVTYHRVASLCVQSCGGRSSMSEVGRQVCRRGGCLPSFRLFVLASLYGLLDHERHEGRRLRIACADVPCELL